LNRSPVDFLAAKAVKGRREAVRNCNHRIVSVVRTWCGYWKLGALAVPDGR
jgi:hypothetical protein